MPSHINSKKVAFKFPVEVAQSLPGFRPKANGFFTYRVGGINRHYRAWGRISEDMCRRVLRKGEVEQLLSHVPHGAFLLQRPVGAVKRWMLCGPKSLVMSG